MRPRRAGIVAALAIILAACQPSAAPLGGTQPGATNSIPNPTSDSNPAEPVSSAPGEVSGLDGTLTFTSDGGNGSGGTTTESHGKMSVTVHLVIQDGGPIFVDAGSTYSYSETARQDDAQTLSSCGLHLEGTGSGSGPFTVPDGLIGVVRQQQSRGVNRRPCAVC